MDICPFTQRNFSGHMSTCQVGVSLAFGYTDGMANEPAVMIPISLDSAAPPTRPERADAQENRARILSAAAALFREQGVANVNMVDIARKAAVGQGTLYRRFANKGALCLALLDTQMREFQEATFAQLRAMALTQTPFVEQLFWFIDAWIHFQAHHSLLLCAVTQEQPLDSHPQSPPFVWQRMTVHGLLRRAAAGDELAADIDVAFAADAFLALLQPDTLRLQQESGGYTTQQMVAGVQRLLRGLTIP